MSNFHRAAAVLIVVACSPAAERAPVSAMAPRAPAPADRIDALLAQMTLEEKAGQLTQWGAQQTPTGPIVRQGGEADIRLGRVGSILGAYGVTSTHEFQRIAVEESRLKVPLLFAFDVIHGFRTVFPVPLAEAASFDPELAERCARAAAIEAAAHGVHWTYAPTVDIGRDPRWGRVVEGSGEDPYLGAALAVARVRGFRGRPGDGSGLLTTAKHFVAYGGAEGGRDYDTVDVSERTLQEIFLPPFRAAVEAGVDSIMPAFNEIAGTPMHAHDGLLVGTLREQWGFDGIIVSDYTGISELRLHGIGATDAEVAARALAATVDVDMISGLYFEHLPGLVKNTRLSMAHVDAAVRRVLEAKQRLGLFDDPYRGTTPESEKHNDLAPGVRALAREAARESIVLLKNERNLLPLRKQIGTLAVIGELAADQPATLGTWYGAGRAEASVTVLDGIRRALPNAKVVYARGASPGDLLSERVLQRDVSPTPASEQATATSGFDEAERAARGADAVVLVVGEGEDMSGEARSRSTIGLPGAQQALFDRLQKLGKPLVVVLVNGRALAIPEVADQATAIVEAWHLGHEMGNAVSDVLFGDVNPSGKLPVTFPRTTGQVPLYYNHKRTGRPPQAGERYTSKYIDVPWTPQYPFGHGLSYTTFSYGKPELSAIKLTPRDALTVSVRLQNTGKRAGTEVVQLYLRDDAATFTRVVRALRGFRRVTLQPGESADLRFTLDAEDFALLDGRFARVVEPGTFTVYVGGSSETTNEATFEVTEGATLQGPGSAIPRSLRP